MTEALLLLSLVVVPVLALAVTVAGIKAVAWLLDRLADLLNRAAERRRP